MLKVVECENWNVDALEVLENIGKVLELKFANGWISFFFGFLINLEEKYVRLFIKSDTLSCLYWYLFLFTFMYSLS